MDYQKYLDDEARKHMHAGSAPSDPVVGDRMARNYGDAGHWLANSKKNSSTDGFGNVLLGIVLLVVFLCLAYVVTGYMAGQQRKAQPLPPALAEYAVPAAIALDKHLCILDQSGTPCATLADLQAKAAAFGPVGVATYKELMAVVIEFYLPSTNGPGMLKSRYTFESLVRTGGTLESSYLFEAFEKFLNTLKGMDPSKFEAMLKSLNRSAPELMGVLSGSPKSWRCANLEYRSERAMKAGCR